MQKQTKKGTKTKKQVTSYISASKAVGNNKSKLKQ